MIAKILYFFAKKDYNRGKKILEKRERRRTVETQERPVIAIWEGHQGSAVFRVMPVALPEEPTAQNAGNALFTDVLRHNAEEISIDEDDVEMFLFYFLRNR